MSSCLTGDFFGGPTIAQNKEVGKIQGFKNIIQNNLEHQLEKLRTLPKPKPYPADHFGILYRLEGIFSPLFWTITPLVLIVNCLNSMFLKVYPEIIFLVEILVFSLLYICLGLCLILIVLGILSLGTYVLSGKSKGHEVLSKFEKFFENRVIHFISRLMINRLNSKIQKGYLTYKSDIEENMVYLRKMSEDLNRSDAEELFNALDIEIFRKIVDSNLILITIV